MVTSIEIQHKDILGRVLLLKIEVKVVKFSYHSSIDIILWKSLTYILGQKVSLAALNIERKNK